MQKALKNRVTLIDAAKGWGILLVIAGHIITLFSPPSYFIYGFHMPLFFLISGVFTKADGVGFFPYVWKMVKRLLLPYVLIFLTGTVISLLVPVWRVFSFKELILSFLLADPGLVHVGATWFLPCLFVVTVLFYPFYHLIFKRKNTALTVFSLSVLGFGTFFLSKLFKAKGIDLPPYVDVAMMALTFYSTGFLLKKQILKIPELMQRARWYNCLLIFIPLVIIYYFAESSDDFIGMVNSSFGSNPVLFFAAAYLGIAFSLMIAQWLSEIRLLCFIGENSLFIFGFHFIFVDLYTYILSTYYGQEVVCQKNLSIPQGIAGFLFVTVITVALAFAFVKIKGLIFKKKQ